MFRYHVTSVHARGQCGPRRGANGGNAGRLSRTDRSEPRRRHDSYGRHGQPRTTPFIHQCRGSADEWRRPPPVASSNTFALRAKVALAKKQNKPQKNVDRPSGGRRLTKPDSSQFCGTLNESKLHVLSLSSFFVVVLCCPYVSADYTTKTS